MKKMYKTFIITIITLFFSQYVFSSETEKNSSELPAEKITNESTEFPAISLDNKNLIIFTKEKYNTPDIINTPLDYRIAISLFKKDVNKKIPIDLMPYWGGPGKIEDAFIHDFQNQSVLFVIFKSNSPESTGVPYSSDYYFVFAYNKTPKGVFLSSEKLFNYFGNGSDVTNIPLTNKAIDNNLTIDLPINAYTYPYKTKEEIIATLSNNLFMQWMNNNVIKATILRKTKLQEEPNYFDETQRYLIEGDKVSVKDITAGWLAIEYQNSKKGIIKGWIMCKDTDVCK